MIWLLLAAVCADVQTLTGRVVAVSDGDTITVLDSEKTQHKIRLAGIDAPEKKQAFGSKSREALAGMIDGKKVSVAWSGKDKYGRIVGTVRLGERDINREMVALGWAWHYRQFSKSRELQAAEDGAREKRRGLWAEEKPVPPWEFRKAAKDRATLAAYQDISPIASGLLTTESSHIYRDDRPKLHDMDMAGRL